MAESTAKTDNRTVEASISLAVVVASFMYIHEQLLREHLIDVLLAVLVFGIALVLLYRYLK